LHAFEPTVAIDGELWVRRIDAAIARRRLCPLPGEVSGTASTLEPHGLGPDPQGAERLIFSESDLLSGLIVDRYADCLSVQFTSAGLMRWADAILEYLQQATACRAMMVRLDAKTAKYEGVEAIGRCHFGDLDEVVPYRLNGLELAVDLRGGQKTGGYLDQRLNHVAAGKYMAGRRVLDVCCYSGGFGLVAARCGAKSVLGIDSSETAIAAARESARRNQIDSTEFRVADCFDELKRLVDASEQFDAVVLDPPRFAGSRHQIDTALRAYGRLNAAAVQLLPPGGVLVTCSCSGRVSRSDFLNMLLDVGRRRRRDLIVLENRGPAPDHPVAIACPESDYLKCVIAQAG